MTSVDWCPPEASSFLCLTSARSLEGYSLGEMNLGEARTRRKAKGRGSFSETVALRSSARR